jgi:acetolactate synthase-1/2/3 large subunit
MNGADLLCETLLANGVDTCFANPGTSEMHFVAALDRQPRMRCVLGLFEGVVTGAADGYARMAGQPAATLLHLGPGLANGLANLHNARRAHSPVVNIVGEHASWHMAADAPLHSDIESLARPMSGWVQRASGAEAMGEDTAAAVAAARGLPGQVATLILPADAAWGEVRHGAPLQALARTSATLSADAVEIASRWLRNGRRTVLLLGGQTLRASALAQADRIARTTGARLRLERANPRTERGAGRVDVERVVYAVDAALADFADCEQAILVGAHDPVAFFAYPGKRSGLLPPGCAMHRLADPGHDLAAVLDALAAALALPSVPGLCHGTASLPEMPAAASSLTPNLLAAVVARWLPEGAIVCDESVTASPALWRATTGAAPHDWLTLTGGAIGQGLPLATGAAIASPGRKVVALQADGSAMYTPQALWTQARERLDVVTVLLSNRSYAILRGELRQVGAAEPGENARRMLSLDDPTLDWTRMAQSMGVEARRVDTVAGLAEVLDAALRRPGPLLVEAVL